MRPHLKGDYALAYYDSVPNEDVFRLVEAGKKVLDVGCSSGRLAEKLNKEKNCTVVGIETNKVTAQLAKGRCDAVVEADLESLPVLNYPEGYFDVIIFADVLEHCANPAEILDNLKKYVSGYIIVSFPNVANWEIRLRLLFGQFDYEGGTILDDGHLRFFTLKSMKELIEQAGFRVVEVHPRNMLLKTLGNLWPSLFGWGFVIKAVKTG